MVGNLFNPKLWHSAVRMVLAPVLELWMVNVLSLGKNVVCSGLA